jgi:hypothetical protein
VAVKSVAVLEKLQKKHSLLSDNFHLSKFFHRVGNH